MGFKIRYSQADSTPALEYFPATASESYTNGEALTLDTTYGKLTKCGATAVPKFICAANFTASATGGELIPVIRVQPFMVFTVALQATGTSLVRGNKVTLHTDGLQVTATTTNGVAEIVDFDGTSAGDTVAIRF